MRGNGARHRAKEALIVGEVVDPITVSVIQHRLVSIVEEMGEAMLRTSYSQILGLQPGLLDGAL